MTDQPNNDGHAVLRPPPGYAWQNGELTRVTPTDGHAHHVEGEDPFTAGLRGMVNENRLAVEIDQPGDPARPLDPPGGPVAVYRTAYLAKARDLGLDLGAMSPTRAQFDECIAAGLAAVDAVAVEPDDGLVTRAALDAANAVAWPGGEDDERVSIDDEDDLRAVLAAAAPYLTGHDHPKYQEGYRAGYQRAEGIERIAALQAKPATILGHQPEPTDDGHVHHVEGEDPQTAALRDAVNKNRQVEGIDPPTDHEPTVRVLLLEDGVDSTLDLQVKILDSGIAGASPVLTLSRPGEDRPAVTIAQRLLLRVAAAVAPSPDPVAVFGRYDHTERTGSAVIYDRGGRLDLKWVDRAAHVAITPDVVEGFVDQVNTLRADLAETRRRASEQGEHLRQLEEWVARLVERLPASYEDSETRPLAWVDRWVSDLEQVAGPFAAKLRRTEGRGDGRGRAVPVLAVPVEGEHLFDAAARLGGE